MSKAGGRLVRTPTREMMASVESDIVTVPNVQRRDNGYPGRGFLSGH